MTDIKSMTIDELKELMTQIGEKPFRAKQIYSWLHEHLVTSYDEMANLPKNLKQKLADYPIDGTGNSGCSDLQRRMEPENICFVSLTEI
mgnify:CR=1 FL=1